MIEASNISMALEEGAPGNRDGLVAAAARALSVEPDDISEVVLIKRSVDARKRKDIHFVVTLGVALDDASLEQKILTGEARYPFGTKVKAHVPSEPLQAPDLSESYPASYRLANTRPVVVGFGPAGMFAALYLAEAGLRPVVIERGGSIEERMEVVERFDNGGPLDTTTNIQFGEGGAGTFSDGKLTTGTKSPLVRHVLQAFVDAGAPPEILWEAKPHIGTDKLVDVVRAIRARIEKLGGEVRFHTKLTGLSVEGGVLSSALVETTKPNPVPAPEIPEEHRVPGYNGSRSMRIPARYLILACGHSARDTFEMLKDTGFNLEQKPFSMGVRIEHLQSVVNKAQYGPAAKNPALPVADYKLVEHLKNGRSAYTFCMCPGGTVVCAASEEDGVVVNGMSRFARDGKNANSALLVGVSPDDFPSDDPLAGVELQRQVERAAQRIVAKAGGSKFQAPAQTVGDFLAGTSGNPSATVEPSYARGVAWCDLHDCLPKFVSKTIEQALAPLGRKLRGFDDPDAVMTGVETRSSSPVRIVRDGADLTAYLSETGEDESFSTNVYPCGEGAGYAGGIMSAAVDGLRCAMALVGRLAEELPEEEGEEPADVWDSFWTNCPVD